MACHPSWGRWIKRGKLIPGSLFSCCGARQSTVLLLVLAGTARPRTDWISMGAWWCFGEGWPAGTIVHQQAPLERCWWIGGQVPCAGGAGATCSHPLGDQLVKGLIRCPLPLSLYFLVCTELITLASWRILGVLLHSVSPDLPWKNQSNLSACTSINPSSEFVEEKHWTQAEHLNTVSLWSVTILS